MKIIVLGSGYVGLVTGTCFADRGYKVYCIDVDPKKVESINKGISPIYEPGLDELLVKNIKNGNLKAYLAEDFYEQKIPADISFICVPTPSAEDGSMDFKFVETASKDLGKYIKDLDQYHVVVTKSTVVPGTTDSVVLPLLEKYSGKKVGRDFGLCMNPEFLREGTAIEDFFKTDKIVIGEIDKKSGDLLEKVYSSWDNSTARIRANLRTAEMIKYAQNSLLAAKISFINEIANICQKCGVDAEGVSYAIGLDPRINPRFLRFGVGYGGSCFPKDVKALISAAEKFGHEPELLKSVVSVNEKQPFQALKMVDNLEGKTVSILGLSFKPNTDDIREAPSIKIIKELKKYNTKIKAYDPKATEHMKKIFPDITYTGNPKDCLKDSDVCFIITEWKEIKELEANDFLTLMNTPLVVDGRRAFDPVEMKKAGISYKGIGYGVL